MGGSGAARHPDQAPKGDTHKHVPGELIVKFWPGVTLAKQDERSPQRGSRRRRSSLPTGQTVDGVAAMIPTTLAAGPVDTSQARSASMSASAVPTTRKSTIRREKKAVATVDDIAVRAYFLHLEDATAGELDNWARAERELLAA